MHYYCCSHDYYSWENPCMVQDWVLDTSCLVSAFSLLRQSVLHTQLQLSFVHRWLLQLHLHLDVDPSGSTWIKLSNAQDVFHALLPFSDSSATSLRSPLLFQYSWSTRMIPLLLRCGGQVLRSHPWSLLLRKSPQLLLLQKKLCFSHSSQNDLYKKQDYDIFLWKISFATLQCHTE